MPQPFKRKGRNIRMSPAVILEEPAFATLIALVATHWNKVEQGLGIMYTWLLMGQEPSAFEFYGEVRRLSARRAKIVHGTWCRTDTKPASLLLADPRHMNQKINEMLKYVRAVQKDKSKLETYRNFPIMPDEYQEYHVRDFQALMKDLVDADNKVQKLGDKVLARALELVRE